MRSTEYHPDVSTAMSVREIKFGFEIKNKVMGFQKGWEGPMR